MSLKTHLFVETFFFFLEVEGASQLLLSPRPLSLFFFISVFSLCSQPLPADSPPFPVPRFRRLSELQPPGSTLGPALQ